LQALEAIGTPYHVIARGLMELQEKDNGHRIIRLARVRNAVLEPLIAAQNSTSFTDPESFETVLYLNDVFHCHGDVLELLLEKQRNQAVQACGIDFGPSGILYDRWVLRNMRGEYVYALFLKNHSTR
jgi:alpha-1,3-mannosyltransferase